MKKILALALALVMVLGLATTVSAADSYTISVDSSDNHTYEVFQIFVGTLNDEGVLTDVSEGKNCKAGIDVDAALAALEALNNGTDAEKLAEALKYVDLGSEKFGSVSASASLSAEAGYYLLRDQAKPATGETYSLYILKIVGNVSVEGKRGTVTSQKKVDDVNDSTGTVLADQDSADYDVGDDVPFTLTAKLPENYDKFDEYFYLAFHDDMAAGLSFNNDVKVYVDGVQITEGFTVVTEGLTDGCTFEVRFPNVKEVDAAKAESVITVEYTAELTDAAVLGKVGNENEMFVRFSNNPNYVWDGKSTPDDPEDPDNPPPTGDTPEDKVIVFTYSVEVDKVTQNPAYDVEKDPNNTGIDSDGDAAMTALSGAGFTLYKYDADATGDEWVAVGQEITGVTTFTWIGIDDGTYKLVETTVPSGYNSIDPVKFEVTASHDAESANPTLVSLSGGNNFSGNVDTGVVTTDIENNPGVVLPGTGGIGTTLFYIIGGLLVVAAVVLLVTKKRMASAE